MMYLVPALDFADNSNPITDGVINMQGLTSLELAQLSRFKATNGTRKTTAFRASSQPDKSSPITTDEIVHASVVAFETAWNGYKYWMVTTPYPSTNPVYENPTIIASNDLSTWEEPAGIVNPVAPKPITASVQGDPGLMYDPVTDRLVIVYGSFGTVNEVRIITSSDGVTWSSSTLVFNDNPPMGTHHMVTFTTGGTRTYRLLYTKNISSVMRMFYRDSTEGIYGDSNSWENCIEHESLVYGMGSQVDGGGDRMPWDFQAYRLASGEWLFSQVLVDSIGGSQAKLYLGFSQDNCATIQYFKNPLLTINPSGWPEALIYVTALVCEVAGTITLINTSKGTGDLWGMQVVNATEQSYTEPAPILLKSNFASDASNVATIYTRGALRKTYTQTGTGTFTSNKNKGLTVPAGRKLTVETNVLSGSAFTASISFRTPTDVDDTTIGDTFEIASIAGLKICMTHDAPIRWLIEIKKPDGTVVYQPDNIHHNTWITVVVAKNGLNFGYGSDSGGTYGSGLSNLSFTQTDEVTLGNTSNAYDFDVRDITVYRGYTSIGDLPNVAKFTDYAVVEDNAVPTIYLQPQAQSSIADVEAQFICIPQGHPGCTLQWQTSPDNSTWTNAASETDIVFGITSATSIYVRCICTNSQGSVTSSSVLLSISTPVEFTSTYSVSSVYSTYSGHSANNGDGLRDSDNASSTSIWGSNGTSQEWIKADLGASHTLTKVSLTNVTTAAGWGPEYLNGAVLEGSTDNSSWTTLTNISGQSDGVSKDYTVSGSYRYVRLRMASGYLAVGAFRIYYI